MSHLRFEVIEEKPKTKVFSVISTYDEQRGVSDSLGRIHWYGRWRQYIFEPETLFQTIWSDDCLKELYEFLKKLKDDRKKKNG